MLWLSLVLSAYYQSLIPIYSIIGLLLFEGITNWRVPIAITRIRYGNKYKEHLETPACSTKWFGKIEAERMLRFIVAIVVSLSYTVIPDIIWFMPWFMAGMLILAGISNICPMVMFLRWTGFR